MTIRIYYFALHCRSFERTTPISFHKIVTKDVTHTEFFDKKRKIFDVAKPNCLPDIIRMGRLLNSDVELAPHVQFFAEHLKGLPSRLPSIYCSFRLFAFEVGQSYISSKWWICLEWSFTAFCQISMIKFCWVKHAWICV